MRFGALALLAGAIACAGSGPASDCPGIVPCPRSPIARLTFSAASPYAGTLHVEPLVADPVAISLSPAPGLALSTAPIAGPVDYPLAGLTAATTYAVRATAGRDVTDATFTTDAARTFRVLFDAAHGEDAGAADWRIDDDDGPPSPANPASEADWTGGLSSWAFALAKSGKYEVETLGTTGTLSFGTDAPQDLSKFDVLVLPEPNNWGDLGTNPRNPTKGLGERDAVKRFVEAGGGLVLLSDHAGSDRDNDGIDSQRVLKPLLEALGAGVTFGTGKEYAETANFAPKPPVFGPFGTVSRVAMYAGTVFTVPEGEAPGGRGIVFRDGLKQDSHLASLLVYGGAGTAGAGRWFLYGDSSIAGDGTGRRDTPDKAAWGVLSHAPLLLNAVAWAAHEY